MENTRQNKERFFNLYKGLPVFHIEGLDKFQKKPHEEILPDDYVSLRSIESLKDEEIYEVYEILGFDEDDEKEQNIVEQVLEGRIICQYTGELFDYLRSIGVLIPFMGFSCEEIINRGWAKLREEKE